MKKKYDSLSYKINLSLLPKLVKLGFTKQEAQVYLTLCQEGPLDSKHLSYYTNALPHAIYRVIKRLENKKLVAILKTKPLTFQSLPAELALNAFAQEKASLFEKEALEIVSGIKKPSQIVETTIKTLFGQLEMFNLTKEMIDKARKEVLIISIGENIPEELLLSDKEAIGRGVKIKMIAHKYDQNNQDILRNFQKNDIEVKHYPDWGFHMVIVDKKKSLLVVNNPQSTRERVNIQFFSEGLSKALSNYFYSVWEKATPI